MDAQGTADLSPDGRYRYRLSRTWGPAPLVTFVMLNPSTADGSTDDPTIRRCAGFARSWGYGGLVVANLYAYRATRPADLWQADDPVGPANDEHLRAVFASSGLVVAAWGAHARPDRVDEVLSFAPPLVALALTKAGHPRHPLYVRAAATPTLWPGGAARDVQGGPTIPNCIEPVYRSWDDYVARLDPRDVRERRPGATDHGAILTEGTPDLTPPVPAPWLVNDHDRARGASEMEP